MDNDTPKAEGQPPAKEEKPEPTSQEVMAANAGRFMASEEFVQFSTIPGPRDVRKLLVTFQEFLAD